MGFTKKFNQDFFLKDNRIVLSENYLKNNVNKFKKITGSRFASILGQSEFVSPAKVWAMMVNIYFEPMEELFANAGNVIEPKIKDWVCQQTKINYIQYNPSKVGFDIFKDNKIFGGIPDGEPVDEQGKLLYPQAPILEIKTSSIDSFVFRKNKNLFELVKDENGAPKVKNKGEKRQKWFSSTNEIIIPKEYKFQLGLYCYLRNVSKGIFAICFLETNDYLHPEKCSIDEREKILVDFDVNLKEFRKSIDYANDWYETFIKKGISPKLSDADLAWFNSEEK